MPTPIIQFGTSRFLQAHADLFVSDALARGEALGRITVVQTTASPGTAKRVAALNSGAPFPVRIRGLENGAPVDRTEQVNSVARAFAIADSWQQVEDIFVHEAAAVVSNTGDRGYDPDPSDTAETPVPRGFPAKLTKLLHARFRHHAIPIDLFPCELIPNNGAVLRSAVLSVAEAWRLDPAFREYLAENCRWADSLVDRIVSESLEPVGAVAEPYALWAIRAQRGVQPICRHDAIVLTDDLERYERLKLLILNLGHSYLAERWLRDHRPAEETVREALADPALAMALDALYDTEVLPVFAALDMAEASARYRQVTLARLRNPFLNHRLADIAANHEAKKRRRFGLLVSLGHQYAPGLKLPITNAVLAPG
jgi:tagaturonate reductase